MQVPFRCPVCNGRGSVQAGFYSGSLYDGRSTSCPTPETCRSCGGTGIVWSWSADAAPIPIITGIPVNVTISPPDNIGRVTGCL